MSTTKTPESKVILEPGTSPTSSSSCSYSGSESEDDSSFNGSEDEDIDLKLETTCLFCPEVLPNPDDTLSHCKSIHDIDIVHEFRERDMDCIDFIKLVNYLRSREPMNPAIVFTPASLLIWKEPDTFMKPVFADDPLLTFDIESSIEDGKVAQASSSSPSSCGAPNGASIADSGNDSEVVTLNQYQLQIRKLEDTICTMKGTMRGLLTGEKSKLEDQETEEKRLKLRRKKRNDNRNSDYFSTYSHFGIHHEMLSDIVRTSAYRESILQNGHLFQGKRVLDVGCGTGILSMFSAAAGAKEVTAVDDSDIAFYAMTIVGENKLKNQIEIVKCRVENLKNKEKYDVIISEWMGYFLVYEGMHDTVLHARDNFMNEGGIVLPNRSVIFVAGISSQEFYHKHVLFWNDVYGYRMSSMIEESITEPMIGLVDSAMLCTEDTQVYEINTMTCKLEDTINIDQHLVLKVTRDGVLHGIVGWFDSFFDHESLTHKETLSTSPHQPPTHWKQTSFLLRRPFQVHKGNDLKVRMVINRPKEENRGLRVEFTFDHLPDQPEEYILI